MYLLSILNRRTRRNLRSTCCWIAGAAGLAVVTAGGAAAASAAPVTLPSAPPTALGATASGVPQFRMPEGEPTKLTPAPAPATALPAVPPATNAPVHVPDAAKDGAKTAKPVKPGKPEPAPAAPSVPSKPTPMRGEGKVSAESPVAFLFDVEKAASYSISVSSPRSAARLAIFLNGSKTAELGTEPFAGAIRWTSNLAPGDKVKIVVLTQGPEIPFRVETSTELGSM
ncbi:MAG: hypothetical protein ABI639_10190 [Thermoanaerobaculia bacterium]